MAATRDAFTADMEKSPAANRFTASFTPITGIEMVLATRAATATATANKTAAATVSLRRNIHKSR